MKTPKAAVTVESTLSLPVVAVSPEVVSKVYDLVERADAIRRIESRNGFELADGVNGEIRKLARELEKNRTEVKAPILELGRAVDEACRGLASSLQDSANRLGREVLRFEKAEREKAEKAERERREKEAELQREADAKAAAEAEVADLFEDAPAPEPAPRVELVAPKAAPAPKSKSVSTRRVSTVVVDDFSKIPRAYLVADLPMIKRALSAGTDVPGCHLDTKETLVSKG